MATTIGRADHARASRQPGRKSSSKIVPAQIQSSADAPIAGICRGHSQAKERMPATDRTATLSASRPPNGPESIRARSRRKTRPTTRRIAAVATRRTSSPGSIREL
jgi:hypothetical protein